MYERIILEMKRIIKDPINIIMVLIILFLLGLSLRTEDIRVFHGYAFLHQIAIWWAVLLGYRMAAHPHQIGASEWIQTLPMKNRQVVAQVVSMVLVFGIVVFLMGICAAITSIMRATPFVYIKEGCIALALYYWLTMTIVGIFGWWTGDTYPKIWGYMIAVAIGFVMGSMGTEMVNTVFYAVPLLRPFTPNLGLPVMKEAFQPLLGFDLSLLQWIRRLFWLLIAIYMVFHYRTPKKRKLIFQASGVACMLFVGVAMTFIRPPVATFEKGEANPRKQDTIYYIDYPVQAWQEPESVWESMHIQLDTSNGLSVTGEGVLKMLTDSDHLAWNLFHGFGVTELKLNDSSLQFEQIGDRVQATLPASIAAGETAKVSFRYSGSSAYRFPVRNGFVLLPNYFNWLLQPYTSDSMVLPGGSLITVPQYTDSEVQYTLQWKGNGSEWTNIQNEGSVSRCGVSFLAGHLNTIKRQVGTIIYTANFDPVTIERNANILRDEIQHWAEVLDISTQPLQHIVAMEIEREGLAGFFATSRLAGDTLYMTGAYQEYPPFSANDVGDERMLLALEGLEALLLDQKSFLYQTDDMQRMFLNGALVVRYPQRSKYVYDDDLVRFLTTLKNPNEFLQVWFQTLKKTPMMTREALQDLMDSWE